VLRVTPIPATPFEAAFVLKEKKFLTFLLNFFAFSTLESLFGGGARILTALLVVVVLKGKAWYVAGSNKGGSDLRC
jgi:hypothetical protein